GGMLESAGRFFKRSVKVYAYPLLDAASGRVVTVETLPVQAAWRHLRDFLLETGHLVPIRRYDERLLSIFTKDVLARIQSGDAAWETMVPPVVAQTIKAKRLFGYAQAPERA
ncbi:MAG TPA: TonB-dependent receptor, partial [Methylomirabilota bacterium]|nr:TonB-dependent receptor [Methylomirabilota bacterium]